MLFLTLFFESVCFPTIMALGIRGLGRHYKRGSGFLVGGVCGGAIVPPILGHVADMRNDTGFAFIVPTMVWLLFYTIWPIADNNPSSWSSPGPTPSPSTSFLRMLARLTKLERAHLVLRARIAKMRRLLW